MLLPRLTALCEVQWCTPENKSWNRFTKSIPHLTDAYDIMGYNFAKHIFDLTATVICDTQTKSMNVEFTIVDDAPIRYTLDGSEPTMDSNIYEGPVNITESCTIKAKVFREDIETKVYSKYIDVHKAIGCPVTILTGPLEKYRFGAPASFTDGMRGEMTFNGGPWTGYQSTDMVAVIEMDGNTSYSSVTASALIEKGQHIMNPTSLTVMLSEDGETYTSCVSDVYPVETADDKEGLKEYTVTFPETNAKFIKVVVGCVEYIPDWLGGAPHKGFIFIDEILVK
jgi:hexosaminidase